MGINLSVPSTTELKPRIIVFGVGGAGGNAVNNMINSALDGVEFVVANTDAQALANSLSEHRIQLGIGLTQGLGAGARPDVGRSAAEEALDFIVERMQGSHMAFITAGMGGGTGTGAAPVIARAARDLGILTVGVVTKPFQFEGNHRMRIAEAGIDELSQYVDTLIIIPNQNLFRIANERTTFADAFKMADNVLHSGVRGVTDLMVMPGLINLDFADVRTVMSEMGKAMMGTGEAEGASRALEAADAAIANPLLDDVSMKGAKGVLINITGGNDLTLYEVDEAANRIRNEVDPEANIIVGSTFDESLAGKIRVSVVATGIEGLAQMQPARPPITMPGVVAQAAQAAARPVPLRNAAAPRVSAPAPVPAPEPEPETDGAMAPDGAYEEAENAYAPSVQPAPESVPEAMPVVRPAANGPFIPPRPVEPLVRREPARTQAAYRTQSEAATPDDRGARKPTLFERMTRPVWGRPVPPSAPQPAAPPTLRPEAVSIRATAPQPAVQPQPAVARPAPQPAAKTVLKSPGLGGMDAGERLAGQREDDLLDIPAFLRRQAN